MKRELKGGNPRTREVARQTPENLMKRELKGHRRLKLQRHGGYRKNLMKRELKAWRPRRKSSATFESHEERIESYEIDRVRDRGDEAENLMKRELKVTVALSTVVPSPV